MYDRYERRRVHTAEEQAQLDELYDAPGGVTGTTQRETRKLRNRYRAGLEHHLREVAMIYSWPAFLGVGRLWIGVPESSELLRGVGVCAVFGGRS